MRGIAVAIGTEGQQGCLRIDQAERSWHNLKGENYALDNRYNSHPSMGGRVGKQYYDWRFYSPSTGHRSRYVGAGFHAQGLNLRTRQSIPYFSMSGAASQQKRDKVGEKLMGIALTTDDKWVDLKTIAELILSEVMDIFSDALKKP